MDINPKMKIEFFTLGCKVNQYETQNLKEKFADKGYEVASKDGNESGEPQIADIYVINTCTVTSMSDKKSRQYIRKAKKMNPKAIVAVVGCFAQVSPEEAAAIEGVNIVAGTDEKHRILELIEEYQDSSKAMVYVNPVFEIDHYDDSGAITTMDTKTRAFIKIQEGCNRFCSYCIIPYARGNVRSRRVDQVVDEAKRLISNGVKEIVLTGINTALYGTENGFLADKDDMVGIEIAIAALDALEGDFRIRLGSLEPNVINAGYATRLLKYKKLCPHMHLSLQSGSNTVLEKMNRNYTRESYMEIVKALREHDPGYGITADIIVGFPEETDEDFEESVDLVKCSVLSKVHVFKYSKRSGTKAATMKNQVLGPVKSKRSENLIKIAFEIGKEFCKMNIGTTRTVLIEDWDEEKGVLTGYTENYIKTYIKISPEKNTTDILINSFQTVKLVEVFEDGMMGEMLWLTKN